MAVVARESLLDIHPSELTRIVTDIPTLPAIYQELFRKMQDPNVSVPEIAEMIALDQALTAKILHLVNSAFYGFKSEIKTISRAVVILGYRAVRNAVLAVSVFDYFKSEPSGTSVDIAKFWTHSIATASSCKVLAEQLHIDQQDEAFIVGLLHDVGKIIEKRYFPEDFEDVCSAAREQHLSWFECEQALFQIHHATIGKALFRAWNFPGSVVDAVGFHHAPESASKVPQLAALAHVADFIAYEIGMGAPGAWPPKQCRPAALKLLDLSLSQTSAWYDKIRAEMQHSLQILRLVD